MDGNCSQVEKMGLQKLEIIRHKISELQRLEEVIIQMTNTCKSNDNESHCPIIESLK